MLSDNDALFAAGKSLHLTDSESAAMKARVLAFAASHPISAAMPLLEEEKSELFLKIRAFSKASAPMASSRLLPEDPVSFSLWQGCNLFGYLKPFSV